MFVKPCVVVQTNTLCQASLDESFETVASNEVTAWTHRLNTQHLLQVRRLLENYLTKHPPLIELHLNKIAIFF